MSNLSTHQAYKPVPISRRSEFLAWIFSIILIVILIVLPYNGFFHIAGTILATFFTLSATIMSIGSSMNRKSELQISDVGIWFTNGIRKTEIRWEDIIRVEVLTGRFNDKITVISVSDRLSFDVFKDPIVNGEVSNSVGFKDREYLLKTILDSSNLNDLRKEGPQGFYFSKN